MDGSAQVHPKMCLCGKVLSVDITSMSVILGKSHRGGSLLFQLPYKRNSVMVPTPKHN